MKINGEFNNRKTQAIVDKYNWEQDEIARISSDKIIENEDGTVSHLSNCVVTIKPVQEKTPFQLFGSLRKSIVANKISVYEAKVTRNMIGGVKKGRLIAEALISDEALSRALIEQGCGVLPCTISQLDGNVLDLSEVLPVGNSVERNSKFTAKNTQKSIDLIAEALEKLMEETNKARPSKKATQDAIRSLSAHIYNLSANSEYNIETLIENLKSDSNSFRFEMESTIEKLNFYRNVEEIKMLDYTENYQYDESYLYWYAKGRFNSMERMTLGEVLTFLYKQTNNPKVQKMIDKNSETSSRETGDITDGSIEFSTVYGDTSFADEENLSGRSLEMRIGLATAEESYKIRYSKYRELFRISFSSSDLVRLMRGTGDQFVNATITRFAKCSVPFVKLQKFVQEEINLNHKNAPAKQDVEKLFKELKNLFEDTKMKKADKDKARDIITQLSKKVQQQANEQFTQGQEDQERVATLFEERLKKDIEAAMSSLPAPVAKKALLMLNK